MDISVLFKIIGVAGCSYCFYLGFRLRKKRERLKASGIAAEGIVVDLKTVGNHEQPVIRFKTLQNELVTKEYEIGFNVGQLKQGQKLDIYYNSINPLDFVLDTKVEKWLPIIFMIVGFLFVIILLISLFTGVF